MEWIKRTFAAACLCGLLNVSSWATPEFVEHIPGNGVFGETAGVTMREPEVPREDDAVGVWVKIGYSFFYTDVAIYYTTDGSTPAGSRGVPSGSTQVLRSATGQVSFVRNEPSGSGNMDWWFATLPAATRGYGQSVRYRIGSWHSSGGIEVFSNNYGCSDDVCNAPGTPATYSFTNLLAWPGRGAGYTEHWAGYPPVKFWKEEAVVGNNWINVMLDQNGTVFDVYYPGAGGVYGVGTRNEGYSEGPDTFPPGLPPDQRGQMHVNQVMAGIRVDGKTHWLNNPNGVSYSNVTQSYEPRSNTVRSSARLTADGNDILVQQYDFAPKGVTFPTDLGGTPNRGLYVKRMVLTNQGPMTKTANVYVYADFALNGGDGFDGMFIDRTRGAMVAFDNTRRFAGAAGEYKLVSSGDLDKNVSVYLASAMKLLAPNGSTETIAGDFWSDTSTDQGQGWIGLRVTLAPGQSREIAYTIIGGFDGFAGATGTYNWQIVPALDWFYSTSQATALAQTDAYWNDWVDGGVTVDFPDDRYDELMVRGLLGTALHIDEKGGGLIAGMHNGAYPFVWPRDLMWAAVTLSRVGHWTPVTEAFRYLREVTYRANAPWGGKGFWYQKYTTDGYIIWDAPQVDETAVVPWGAWFHYNMTGDAAFLSQNYGIIYDAGRASSEDSSIDGRLYLDDNFNLMHTMNLWEDQWGLFVYSNANVERGLRDAASIANRLGQPADATLFTHRANLIHNGLRARLQWNGENTDISFLGIVYPFNVVGPKDPDAVRVIDRINGVAPDTFGNYRGLVRGAGEWDRLIDRYWGDGYWGGGPWFLSTMWYGAYYALRQDHNPGKADIDVLRDRVDRLIGKLGPIGFGAEQISPASSLLYPGQTDFRLQTAWPNAWESMSFFVDSIMLFLGLEPDAPGNTLRIAPKLPTAWNTMTFRNVHLGAHRFDITVDEDALWSRHRIVNKTGSPCQLSTWVRIPAGARPSRVLVNGQLVAHTFDTAARRVRVDRPLSTGPNAQTTVQVWFRQPVAAEPGASVSGGAVPLKPKF